MKSVSSPHLLLDWVGSRRQLVAISDLSSKEAVIAALAEYDRIGQEAFLSKYRFGHAREYVLVRNGKRYDSKAIAGAAHGYQFPDQGPLSSADFSGGTKTTSVLQSLGFEIQAVSGGTTEETASGGTISSSLEQILAGYDSARVSQPFGRQSQMWRTFEELTSLLNSSAAVASRTTLRATFSAGIGNWSLVPWIAVLDSRETTTTRSGVYPVFLFRQDLTGVYLTLAQGVWEPKKRLGRRGAYDYLKDTAQHVRRLCPDLGKAGFALDSNIDLRAAAGLGKDYEASTIAYKLYERGAAPEDSDLLLDLDSVLGAYERYLQQKEGGRSTSDHRRLLVIYVGQSGRSNFQVGLNNGIWGFKDPRPDYGDIEVNDLVLFGIGYTGSNARVDLDEWATHGIERGVLGRVSRPFYEDDTPVWPDESRSDVSYPVRLGIESIRETGPFALNPGDALSRAAVDALRLSAINRGQGYVVDADGSSLIEVTIAPPAANPDLTAVHSDFSEALNGSNIKFGLIHDQLVRAFLAALATKPFVILTGLSGSGKTQLAVKLGEWLGEGRYKVVPVRPDWTGAEALFGYEDALLPPVDGRRAWYVPDTLKFMLRAARDPDYPYLLVLDEMNLAHVERYFADVLSGMETRLPTLPNLVKDDSSGHWSQSSESPTIPIPRNLFVAGTVNVDETTYMFSPKVLDRSNTFEFRVDTSDLSPEVLRPSRIEGGPAELMRGFLAVATDDRWHVDHPAREIGEFTTHLLSLHRLLTEGGFEFGHRVFYEAIRFASMLDAAGDPNALTALDLQIMQKVLPRIHG
jgi:MoxR-like ATPase